MAQPMHMSFPMSGGHHLLPPLLPPHALVPDEILDDCTLFGGLQPLLPTPLQPPSGLPGLPAPGALPLPLSVEDDIFQGLDVEDDVFDFDSADTTTPGAAFVDHAVWAKLRSYPAWPAQVLSPHVGHQAPPRPKRPGCVLVHFFGTYDINWVESEKKISPFERDFQLYANKDKSKAFQRAVKEAQHFIATGGPRLGQLPPAMMPESADLMMYPQHSLQPSEGRKRSGGDGAAGGHGTAWGGSGAPGVAVSAPVKPPADGIPRRIKVARRLGLLPPAGGTDA